MFKPVLGGLFQKEPLGRAEGQYMDRYHLTPWKWWPFQRRLYLHRYFTGDGDEQPHDHPMDFRSIILWGGYTEEIWGFVPNTPPEGIVNVEFKPRYVPRRWLRSHFCPAGQIHRVYRLSRLGCVTLVIRGPKTTEWGFFHDHGGGIVEKVAWWKFLGYATKPKPAYGEASTPTER